MTNSLKPSDTIRPVTETVLSDDWATLTKYEFDHRRQDGTWQRLTRQAYDRGNGAVCLLYNPQEDTVLLTRQFRLPVHLQDPNPHMIEAPAGLLEGEAPAARMTAELEEETGYSVAYLRHLYDVYMSPGSVTEFLSFYIGTYSDADQTSAGGGSIEEGEDIEVLHVPFADALAMIANQEIRDAKTIMLLQHLALHPIT